VAAFGLATFLDVSPILLLVLGGLAGAAVLRGEGSE
jgi:hypothetical protein